MISLLEARALIVQETAPLDAESCPAACAQGRLLREDVCSTEDFPAFDRSTMDGYAVRREDASAEFTVVGEVQPGQQPAQEVHVGECVRIFTGAALPPGASQVIMQEEVRREGDRMIPQARHPRTNIRLRGEEARPGDVLLRAGTRLGPAELSLLAHAGCAQVQVTRPPRVLHVATGGELVAPRETPAPWQIRDSNSTLIAALLREASASLVAQRRCGDGPTELLDLLQGTPGDSWDLLLISGGASVGDYDFGKRVLRELGFQTHFTSIQLKPGKPLVFARRGPQVAFVVPGNPVSHYVTYQVAIRAALERLQGAEVAWPLVQGRLATPLPASHETRETYWPARIEWAGEIKVHPLRQQSSGDLGALVGANALLQITPPCAALETGALVHCLLTHAR